MASYLVAWLYWVLSVITRTCIAKVEYHDRRLIRWFRTATRPQPTVATTILIISNYKPRLDLPLPYRLDCLYHSAATNYRACSELLAARDETSKTAVLASRLVDKQLLNWPTDRRHVFQRSGRRAPIDAPKCTRKLVFVRVADVPTSKGDTEEFALRNAPQVYPSSVALTI